MTLSFELRWLKNIDFFPLRPGPGALEAEDTVCVATKSRALGDALALTSLPAKLKAKHPELRITTYPRGFNPLVFRNNPHVSGVSRLPDAVYGDDCNWGEGQLIQLKERFFELPISPNPRPEIHLTPGESDWARKLIAMKRLAGNGEKPLCMIHPWGNTHSNVATHEYWDEFVARWKGHFRFWQVGVLGHGAIQGCEYYALLARGKSHVRKLFALLSQADAFVGVDSGPMHVARAFEVPSLIFVKQPLPDGYFSARLKEPYYVHGHHRLNTLYADNSHVCGGSPGAAAGIEEFMTGASNLPCSKERSK